MKFQSLILTLVFLALPSLSIAQIAAPEVQGVYGGRINDIAGYAMADSVSRIFIATQSANSAFYADVDVSTDPPTYGKFQTLPALDATAGWGSHIQKIGVEENSGAVVFLNNGLHYTDPNYMTVTSPYVGNVEDFLIVDSKIFFITGNEFHFGSFDVNGNFSEDSASPIPLSGLGGKVTMSLNPIDNHIYFFYETNGSFLQIYKTTHDYNSISGSTTFAVKGISLTTSARWRTMGIAPDGRIFFGGDTGTHKQVAYSDDEITWIEMSTMGGIGGNEFAFGGDASMYSVYYASTYSDNKGGGGTWHTFGSGGFQTHPNDGAVLADPYMEEIVYMTTDQGIGSSKNKGYTIFEINEGVEAVQVRDMDMEGSKNLAWFASKSGIRKVQNYQTSPIWSNAIFPNNDGSPYFSSEMDMSDNDIVFVGNVRVYQTMDGGTNWQKVFSAEDPPFNFPSVGSEVRTIEISDDNPNIIMAGYVVHNGGHGGLFVSEDGGTTWEQILIDATSSGQDLNINDIELTEEGGKIVAYVGVDYEMGYGYSIYRVEQSSGIWNVTQDMSGVNTSTGAVIAASIRDITVSSTRDTIFATGTDAGINHPTAYYKPLNGSGKWTPFTTTGFPFVAGKRGYSITLGGDTIYCAVDNEIYYYPVGATEWQLGYSYPVGMEINFLYYDDLLAGTGTGLYEHPSNGNPVTTSTDEIVDVSLQRSWMQVNPNPVINFADIVFQLPTRGDLEISLFDTNGKQVKVIQKGMYPAGEYSTSFNMSQFPNGIYYCTMKFGDHWEMKKILKAD